MEQNDESSSEEELFPIKPEESLVIMPFDHIDPASYSGMMKAVALNDFDLVLSKIKAGKSLREIDNMGSTLLHIAVKASRGNDTKMIDLLLDQEEIDINAKNFSGHTPLMYCLMVFNSELAFHLMKAGASVDNISGTKSALHCCCELGIRDVAEYLIKNGADINALDEDNDTPLHIATLYGQLEMVCLLLYYEADANLINDRGYTPLQLSFGINDTDIIDILVDYSTDRPCQLINTAVSHEYTNSVYLIERIFMNMPITESNDLHYKTWKFIIKQPALRDRFFKHFPLTFSLRDILYRFFMLSEEVDNIDQYAMAVMDEDISVGDDCNSYLITKLLLLLYIRSNQIEKLKIDRTEIDLIYVLLSYGIPVWDVDVDLVYALFGYCDLFKLLLHMNILPSRFVPFNIMSYIIMSTDHMFSLQETVDELIASRGILSYDSHELRCHTKLAFRHVDDSIHEIPSLLDIARVEARNYICRRFQIKNSHQFYTLLPKVLVPTTIKKLLAFEIPLYKKKDSVPDKKDFLITNVDLTEDCRTLMRLIE